MDRSKTSRHAQGVAKEALFAALYYISSANQAIIDPAIVLLNHAPYYPIPLYVASPVRFRINMVLEAIVMFDMFDCLTVVLKNYFLNQSMGILMTTIWLAKGLENTGGSHPMTSDMADDLWEFL
uniref:Uncharacterized protein n=1 Tax=Romanomermis culicivorax TaxID=13658 RepID=A0A915JDG7_ROMCU